MTTVNKFLLHDEAVENMKAAYGKFLYPTPTTGGKEFTSQAIRLPATRHIMQAVRRVTSAACFYLGRDVKEGKNCIGSADGWIYVDTPWEKVNRRVTRTLSHQWLAGLLNIPMPSYPVILLAGTKPYNDGHEGQNNKLIKVWNNKQLYIWGLLLPPDTESSVFIGLGFDVYKTSNLYKYDYLLFLDLTPKKNEVIIND